MRLYQIGELLLSANDPRQDFPLVARSSVVPLRYGAYDQDGALVVLNAGKASANFLFHQPDIDGQIDTLMATVLAGTRILKLKLRDNSRTRVTPAKLTRFSKPVDGSTYEPMQQVSLEWALNLPYWLDAAQIQFADTGLRMDDGVVLDGTFSEHTITSTPYTFSIAYGGTARGTYGAVTIAPEDGGVLGEWTLTNLTNGLQFRYEDNIAGSTDLSNRVDIDFLERTVSLAGSNDLAHFYIDNPRQTEWMALEPGGNNFLLEGYIEGTVHFYYQYCSQFG